jgi:hypothetical protein
MPATFAQLATDFNTGYFARQRFSLVKTFWLASDDFFPQNFRAQA